MDVLNSLLNIVVPPASLVMLAFAWPTLTFIHACEWIFNSFYTQNMEDKVVLITGASSGIGEQIAYGYARRGANLALVARRENRLRGISENAVRMGAKCVTVIAADVVKEDDCRRFVNETINTYGRLDHLVNTASLGHTFYFGEAIDTSVFPLMMDINFWGNVYPTCVALPYLKQSNGRIIVNASVESWLPLPRMSLYAAAKAAVMNFYETLRFEIGDEVGITIATHGWIGTDQIIGGKLQLDEGAEMQWREEKDFSLSSGPVEEYARLIVSGACRGDAYVKFPNWYDIFMVYRVFSPDVLSWTFRLLFSTHDGRKNSFVGTGRPLREASSPRKLLTGLPSPPQLTFTPLPHHQQHKFE